MAIPELLIAVSLILPGQLPENHGTIRGTVVNATHDGQPVGDAEVVLRAKLDGQMVPVAQTTTDSAGNFEFSEVPVAAGVEYLPGANHHDIHYPGPRVRLSPTDPEANVQLSVCDSITAPNPLVIRRHDIVVCPVPGALSVTETIVVANPTRTCYIGRPTGKAGEPVTLRLHIPSDFERTTFDKEFFGRRFSLADGTLVTGIPWTPGEREVKFTYLLRNSKKQVLWQRPLDLPCQHVRLSVETKHPEEVACSLGSGKRDPNWPTREDGTVRIVFESQGETLPAGEVLRLELGKLPVSWMANARWLALGALALAVSGGVFLSRRRGRHAKDQNSAGSRLQANTRQRCKTVRKGRKRQKQA